MSQTECQTKNSTTGVDASGKYQLAGIHKLIQGPWKVILESGKWKVETGIWNLKFMIFMTLASSYTFLAMGICAAGVSQRC